MRVQDAFKIMIDRASRHEVRKDIGEVVAGW